MFYFVPAWYKENTWSENEQLWYRRRMKSEFDETIKQVTLFHRNVDVDYQILLLAYSPNFRHFLHRQGMYRAPYWSCFDAIAQVRRRKMSVLSYHNIKWPQGVEFIYSPFAIVVYLNEVKYAQVEYGEDGNPIMIDMFEDGKICRRNYYDDRGFVSSTVLYQDGQMLYQDYLMENGVWKIRVDNKSGRVSVNPDCPLYDVRISEKSDDEIIERHFKSLEYDSLEEVICEVVAGFVEGSSNTDSFFVAAHMLHLNIIEKTLINKKIILSFFEDRFEYSRIPQIQKLLRAAAYIITDSQDTAKSIKANLPGDNLNIMDIPPYDSRMDFGISQQLKVQNILIPVDSLDSVFYKDIICEVLPYLKLNKLARVHIFTRNAAWGHDEQLRRQLAEILKKSGYDERWVYPDAEQDNDEDENQEPIEQRFFVDVCVDERTISRCINEQRVILDLRGIADVFLHITAISKGVPRISFTEDQFLVNNKNGLVIENRRLIGESISYYLDSLDNWNTALVGCYEISKNYSTGVLLDKWRKVLGIVE